MNGFLIMVPLFLIRFGLMGIMSRPSLSRAAFFAPLEGKERGAGLLYQISNILIILYPLFLKLRIEIPRSYLGLVPYLSGTAILIISTVSFARPEQNGLNRNGIYNMSRNPMYLGYFFYFLGCSVLLQSVIMLGFLLIFQVAAHWIIRSEERWCIRQFGEEYLNYMKKVRRYL